MHVELRCVGKRFGRFTALRNVTLDVPSGGRVALVGPNGAGKSTLTRVIMGMLAADGEVLLDGRSAFRERAELARRLAYVPQVAPRLGATVGELVAAIARLRGIDPARIAATGLELGLDFHALRRSPVRDLSGGMRQKLVLALGLSSGASLLILDEPTASLDTQSRRQFFRMMAELPGRPTVLLCSHRLEEIRQLVDRVVVLEDGEVVHDGDATEYLGRRGHGVIEVRVSSDRASQWLAARGFRRGTADWWRLETFNGRRTTLVGELVTELRDDLADVVIRDVEHLDLREENDR